MTTSKYIQKKTKLIHGVGLNDADYKTSPKINGKQVICPFYNTWKAMLRRCYCAKSLNKQPTYINCSVSLEWLSFMAFRSWMITQDWYGKQLDKDILIPGNRIYSKETCLFITVSINTLMNNGHASRGKYPQGVSFNKKSKMFQSHISINNKQKTIGLYPTVEEADKAYRKSKAAHVYDVAMKQKNEQLKNALLRHSQLFINND